MKKYLISIFMILSFPLMGEQHVLPVFKLDMAQAVNLIVQANKRIVGIINPEDLIKEKFNPNICFIVYEDFPFSNETEDKLKS